MTQRERLHESLAARKKAEETHQNVCEAILAEIEAEGQDGSLEFLDNMIVEADAEEPTCIQYPITINEITTKSDPLLDHYRYPTGSHVAIKPCADQYGGKTYLGIFIGDLARAVTAEYHRESGVLVVRPFLHNPAIFVPDLNKVIMGYESFWHVIESEEDMKDISEEDIASVWYVKAIKQLGEKSCSTPSP